MKLEAPPRFNGKRPRVQEWLVDIWRWMRLMRYPPEDWVDIVATRCEGAASAWMNSTMQKIDKRSWSAFEMWSEFYDPFATAIESVIDSEEVRWQLRNLKQTSRATGYVQRFREPQFWLPSMTEEEAFSAFIFGLKPHLAGHVGAHTHGDLSAVQAMAKRLDHYTTSTKGDVGPSGGSSTIGGWSSG